MLSTIYKRLYKQGTSKQRIWKYWVWWLGWAWVVALPSTGIAASLSQHCNILSDGYVITYGIGDDDEKTQEVVSGHSGLLGSFCIQSKCSSTSQENFHFIFTHEPLGLNSISYGADYPDLSPGLSDLPFYMTTVSSGNHACVFKIISSDQAELATFKAIPPDDVPAPVSASILDFNPSTEVFSQEISVTE